MRNLSALGAIHSPIDADRDPSAYTSDFEALGLPDRSPFDILSRPRAEINTKAAPKKRGPKPRTALQKVLGSLRDPGDSSRFNTPIMTRAESDLTLAIGGRGMS